MQRNSFRSRLGNFVGLGLAATVACSVFTVTATPAGAVVLPNPCSLAPARLVAPALGVPAATLHGVIKTYKGKYPLEECVFMHSSMYAEVGVAPAAYGEGGSGGPGGMVTSHPSGLGPEGEFVYDSKPVFANAHFIKGARWGVAFSNAHVPSSTVLALGRYVYEHL
jgi:hypothetical protein